MKYDDHVCMEEDHAAAIAFATGFMLGAMKNQTGIVAAIRPFVILNARILHAMLDGTAHWDDLAALFPELCEGRDAREE